MAIKVEKSDDATAIVEHFKALPFDQQLETLKAIQAVVQEAANEQRQALLSRLAELDALAGRPAPAHSKEQAGEGRPRGKAPITIYDPVSKNYSTGRGSWKNSDWVKEYIAKGGDLEKLRVGPDNPLPPELANQ